MSYCGIRQRPSWTNWAEGLTHALPSFLSWSEMLNERDRRAAIAMRRRAITELVEMDALSKLQEFPEWRAQMNIMNLPLDATPEMILSRLTPSMVRPARRAGSRAAKRYASYRRKWQDGGAYRYFMRSLLSQVGIADDRVGQKAIA